MTQKQKEARQAAVRKQDALHNLARDISSGALRRHAYVYSPAGLGKTHTVKSSLEQSNVNFKLISGSMSMPYFAVELATLNYQNQDQEEVLILVDDCDSMFLEVQFANTVKGVLERGKPTLQYNKYGKAWINTLSEIQQEAIKFHSNSESMGFTVPTGRFRFCFLSNIKLPTKAEQRKTGIGRSFELELHRSAIRSRCRTLDIEMSNELLWGWVANVVLDSEALMDDLGEDNYEENALRILEWLWTNRGQIKELSIRTAQKMAECLIDGGDSDDWEDEFLENRNAA
jgi:hypothetical protein